MSAGREFCTLFDSNYLIKAVAMYRSLERTCPSFQLTAFCFDDLTARLLGELGLDRMTIVPLKELEAHDAALLSVKGDRTPVEYCWTATPALPLYMFQTRPDLDEITYLDADLLFFADPEALFDEMGGASVLITPHRFSPEYASEEVNGIYNVQFLTFRRDRRGMEALQWWHDRCIEWCYYRLEDGKLGDQKYLDDWTERFEGVHVLRHKGGGLAPWNAAQYRVAERDGMVFIDDDPLIFFHYHRVQLRHGGKHEMHPPGYHVGRDTWRLVYRPYLTALNQALEELRGIDPAFERGLEPMPPLRERVQAARVRVGEAARRRAPFLEYVRHPMRMLPAGRSRAP